jgi:hypothetical protein
MFRVLFISVLLFIFKISYAQNSEQLIEKIATTYCDSLIANMPAIFNQNKYEEVERYYREKIFTLQNKDIEKYLFLYGDLSEKGILKTEIFEKITQQIQTCDFYIAYHGAGAKRKDIKASQIEIAQKTCQCLDTKLPDFSNSEIWRKKQKELNEHMKSCLTQSLIDMGDENINDYDASNPESSKKYLKGIMGYLYANCPKITALTTSLNATSIQLTLDLEVMENYNLAGWNIANEINKRDDETLSNQFVNLKEYAKSIPELQQLEKFFKGNLNAKLFFREKDVEKKASQTTVKFTYSDKKKAIGRLIVDYDISICGKVKTVTFIPRDKIEILKELDDYIKISASDD